MMSAKDPIQVISYKIRSDIYQMRKRLARLRTERRRLEEKSRKMSLHIDKRVQDIEVAKQKGLMKKLGNSRRKYTENIQELNGIEDDLACLNREINDLEDDLEIMRDEYKMYKD